MPVSLAQTIELFTHVLSGITINIIPDKEQKYRTVRLNTGQLATLTAAHGLNMSSKSTCSKTSLSTLSQSFNNRLMDNFIADKSHN